MSVPVMAGAVAFFVNVMVRVTEAPAGSVAVMTRLCEPFARLFQVFTGIEAVFCAPSDG